MCVCVRVFFHLLTNAVCVRITLGWAIRKPDEERKDMTPIFETILSTGKGFLFSSSYNDSQISYVLI